ncbi:uncharacterized protein BJ212DRAFT_1549027 [Suillus subaureus]|uniref:Uncharacterized protein n=1 Tax=Suillus subaureus TaxID=48587 RepID=A0A9P7J5S1_9AGAM|nr:uncharacterized protein BJ212DRAFT_1549027 [Suillus subaureus]KAG1803966.1 hypothetical protein BJ212DRAFT_1549027 [Suillus subaureus]
MASTIPYSFYDLVQLASHLIGVTRSAIFRYNMVSWYCLHNEPIAFQHRESLPVGFLDYTAAEVRFSLVLWTIFRNAKPNRRFSVWLNPGLNIAERVREFFGGYHKQELIETRTNTHKCQHQHMRTSVNIDIKYLTNIAKNKWQPARASINIVADTSEKKRRWAQTSGGVRQVANDNDIYGTLQKCWTSTTSGSAASSHAKGSSQLTVLRFKKGCSSKSTLSACAVKVKSIASNSTVFVAYLIWHPKHEARYKNSTARRFEQMDFHSTAPSTSRCLFLKMDNGTG